MGAGLLDSSFIDTSSQTQQTNQTTDLSKALSQNQQANGDIVQYAPNISAAEGIGTLNLTDQGAIKAASDLVNSTVPAALSGASGIASKALDLANTTKQSNVQSIIEGLGKAAPWLALAGALYFLAKSDNKKKASDA